MNNIITELADKLAPKLKTADEIWISVALLNYDGLKFITENLPLKCIQSYLVGIDLPTDPRALRILFDKQFKSDLKVKVYTGNECFHPKLYLIRTGNSLIGFVGSANCTNGGLSKNIELTIQIDEQITCKQLGDWFNKLFEASNPLSDAFLRDYQVKYSARQVKKREDERIIKQEKEKLVQEFEVTLRRRSAFIKMLKKYRKNAVEYTHTVNLRKVAIQELRSTLDYPNFVKINIDKFFGIWELGHIMAFPIPTIKREIKKFTRLLKMLCDEKIDIMVRYNKALEPDFKIRGVNEGLISKLLAIHNPDIYYVKNGKTDKALRKYGLKLQRGLSKGLKYRLTCKFLQQICKETDIKNLAVLDEYLYNEGNME